jgi:hypothetical protein
MAVTPRGKHQDSPDTSELEVRLAKAERMITILLLVLNRDIVRNRPGMPGATYRQIMVNEQRLASLDEINDIESWLSDQHGG